MRIPRTIKTGYSSNETTSAQINQQLQRRAAQQVSCRYCRLRRCCSTSLPLLSSTSLLFNNSESQCRSEARSPK
uniref:Candidate secreted effector n=2 Tax=Meloidogyne incognita TaxID=6306 RepID=A0A914KR03_MELIC